MLGIEAALGPHRHDYRVLDLLRLGQAQHLSAEVIAPVAPAQAAARDRPETQVHALHLGRPDEYLEIGLGRGQVGQGAAGDLQADIGLGRALIVQLVVIGAHAGLHQQGQAAQHPVGV